MTVRTQKLYGGGMSAATATLYTVPANRRTIVKWVSVTHIGNVSTTRLRVKAGGVVLGYILWQGLTSNVPVRLDVWCVLEAGESLEAFTDAGTPSTVAWLISGTELVV